MFCFVPLGAKFKWCLKGGKGQLSKNLFLNPSFLLLITLNFNFLLQELQRYYWDFVIEYCFGLETSAEKAASQTVTLGDKGTLDVPVGRKKKIWDKN